MYYRITLINPFNNKIITTLNSFPIYATLAGITPSISKDEMYVYKDLVTDQKIYHYNKYQELTYLYYLEVKEVNILEVKEFLKDINKYYYDYLNCLNEFKKQVIIDSLRKREKTLDFVKKI